MSYEKYLSRQALLDVLEVGYPLFRKLRNEGGPEPRGTGKNATWPLYAWCEWLVNRRSSGAKARALTLRAAAILRDRDGVLVPEIIEPVTRETGNEEIGLEAALDRLRHAEQATFSKWQQSFNAGMKESPLLFKDWQQALDLLRKAEKNLTDHMIQRRYLLPADQVRTWMLTQITAAKSALLNLPGKLAPQLENQPWPKIQKKLEEEIRFALDKLSSEPR